MKRFAIGLIRLLHFLLLIFVFIGWLVPYEPVLWAHVILLPLIVIQWWVNNGQCILTNMEHYLRREEVQAKNLRAEGGFTRELVQKFCGFEPSDRFLCRLIYGIVIISFLLSWAHLKLMGAF